MLKNAEQIRAALRALGEKMEFHQIAQTRLVVCGGAAMLAWGLSPRATRDVDVVALAEEGQAGEGLRLLPADLPVELQPLAKEVAEDFGLWPSWINIGPHRLLSKGLPVGIEQRLRREDFGSKLQVYWVSAREDFVCFKLYAAASRGSREAQHIQDLEQLGPTENELIVAAEWAQQQDDGDEFKAVLKRLLQDMGHQDIAYNIQ